MTGAQHAARVTVVEDHRLFAETLDLALTLEGHRVCRVALDEAQLVGRQLSAAILDTRPHLVLVDLDLGARFDGVTLLDPLQRAGVAVVVVTAGSDEARWGECLAHGARAVVSKSVSLDSILTTIRMVVAGRPAMDAAEVDRLLQRYRQEVSAVEEVSARLNSLSRREREILLALMKGRHVRDIARDAVVSEATVRTQVKSVLAKLAVPSQLAAVGLAHRARWPGPPPD